MRKSYIILFLLLLISPQLIAQVCTGSLGDPTANIDFGQGTNFIGNALISGSTTYNFSGADCPSDGSYVITNRTAGCFGSAWHTLTEDHTVGDTNGYMMLVNAAYSPGIFYTFSVDNLCPNTTYEFSSYIINVLRGSGIKPKITFRVEQDDGTLIQTYSTGDILENASPTWTKYGFFFKSPTNVSKIVLKLINDAPGGGGNDLALDDITFRPCGPTIFAALGGASMGITPKLCEGTSGSFDFTATISSGYTNPAFQWQVNENNGVGWVDILNANSLNLNVQINNAKITGYTYRLAAAELENITSQKCRVLSNEVSVTVINQLLCAPILKIQSTSATLEICEASAGNFSFLGNITPGYADPAFQWQVNENKGSGWVDILNETNIDINVFINSADALGYSYRLTAAEKVNINNFANRVVSNEIGLTINNKLIIDAGPDIYTLENTKIKINAKAPTGLIYKWTPTIYLDDASLLQPTIAATQTITYMLEVSNPVTGCFAQDFLLVDVLKNITIPNTFTPNGDGVNDFWQITGLMGNTDVDISVFNRDGQNVYKNKGYQNAWDGFYKNKALPVGVYYYIIDLHNDILPVYKGSILILR
jgi:gliding motility-associated-like protein